MTYRRLQVYFFLAMCAAALVLSFVIFRPYLGLIVFAGILAILASPLHRRLLAYFRGLESLAALSTVALTLIVILLPLLFVGASLVTEIAQVYTRVRTDVGFDDVERTLSKVLSPEQAHRLAAEAGRAVSDVASYAQPFFASLTSNLFAIFSNTVTIALGFLLVLMGMYYFLKDGPALKKELLDLSPLADEDDATIFNRIRDAVEAVAIGGFTVALVKGLVGGILFFALKLPTPVFWGSMIALSNFVPGIGTAAVTAPFAIYLFAVGKFWSGLALSLVSVLVIGLVDNFVTPQLIRRRIHIHPMLILFSILGGLSVFGGFGVFFGPIILSVTLALIDLYKKEFRSVIEKA